MAQLGKIKFEFKGIEASVGVNCNSAGQFSATFPEEVSAALRIDKKITKLTLAELEKSFQEALKRYKEAETKEELLILISYHSRGFFAKSESGDQLFGGYRHKYNLEVNFDRPKNAVGLDFLVVIKETIDGKSKYYKANLGKECSWIQKKEYSQPDVYHKQEEIWNPSSYKIIPFSESALQSLKNASEKIRKVSELLFNFIEQDEDQIFLTLTNQKLLN